MNEDFVTFEIAKKLKEKGFTCKYPIAMYNEIGEFHALYTSYTASHNENIKSIFGNREYYDYDDFDDRDFIAPTISQVLKWLREEKKMYIQISLFQYCYDYCILDTNMVYYDNEHKVLHQGPTGYSYNEAALAGIEYVLDNLI